jgi:hypothetical protein
MELVDSGGSPGPAFTATNGQRFPFRGALDDEPAVGAMRASGAHDLHCPPDRVTVRALPTKQWIVDGCGKRAVYALVDAAVLLTGLVSLEPAPAGSR